jgi:ABC-type multidrug transport system fused ATPase/permease subunit
VDLADFLWSLFVIYFMVIYFIMLFRVITDVFRDKTLSGVAKAGWLIFILIIPLIALIAYVITRGAGMAERDVKAANSYREAQDDYIRQVAGTGDNATEQIARAHELLSTGAISQQEFEALKTKALS